MSTPQRGGKATRRPGSPPLPRGGGMAGGIKGEEQDDDGGFEGGRKKAQTPETDAALENLDTMTTVEYNRWLVTENNWSMAEASRQQRIEGEQFRKTREDRHRERGQMRQQDTVEQMKEAKTKVDAHRRSNLEVGSAVKREVIAWNAAAHEDKQKWIKFAQSVKSALNAADVRVNRDELIATKKQNGVEVRSEVQGLTVEKEKLREAYLSANKKQMEKVKEETADKVLDESKKTFFLQRKNDAKETATMVNKWSKQRTENRASFLQGVANKAAKVRGARDGAKNARVELARQRAEAAAVLREDRAGYQASHRQQTEQHAHAVKDTVNSLMSERFVQPESASKMLQHPHYAEVSAVTADVTSTISREIASSPRRSRRPASPAAAITNKSGGR